MPWLDEMAKYAKHLAPKQLIISGTEGFYVPESGRDLYLMNPGGWQQAKSRHAVLLYGLLLAGLLETNHDWL